MWKAAGQQRPTLSGLRQVPYATLRRNFWRRSSNFGPCAYHLQLHPLGSQGIRDCSPGSVRPQIVNVPVGADGWPQMMREPGTTSQVKSTLVEEP